jgi:phosphatidylglycerophosphate synthase
VTGGLHRHEPPPLLPKSDGIRTAFLYDEFVNPNEPSRRPIAARNTSWAAATARGLVKAGVKPNTISVFSAVFGGVAGLAFWLGGRSESPTAWIACLLGAAAGMQLRLLCNLFDGMVAIEGGFKTKSGEVFNELPDRFSDAFVFIGAGYAMPTHFVGMPALGWLAAVLAVATAYVRAMGVAAGSSQHFCGPMAKQQRMAVMTVAALVACAESWWSDAAKALPLGLGIVVLGSLITVFRRTGRIISELESR